MGAAATGGHGSKERGSAPNRSDGGDGDGASEGAGGDDRQRPAAEVAFLADVQRLADQLLQLDLDGVAPGGRFDPGWPGEGR